MSFRWPLGLSLVLLFGVPRFVLVLWANAHADYRWVSVIFVLMGVSPFVLLTSKGRARIGMKKTKDFTGLLSGFLAGGALAGLTYLLGEGLYGDTIQNWYVYIARSYALPDGLGNGTDKLIVFLIFALVAMTFSPIGEELLYRGLIYGSLATVLTGKQASRADSAAFALTHLSAFWGRLLPGQLAFFFLAGFTLGRSHVRGGAVIRLGEAQNGFALGRRAGARRFQPGNGIRYFLLDQIRC